MEEGKGDLKKEVSGEIASSEEGVEVLKHAGDLPFVWGGESA